MGLFYLLWMTLIAQVSCQEVTIDACTRNEVNFTCVIRGSPSLTRLILAWSSPEYIGQGDALRFTTAAMPGMNSTSVINGNVTAILTSNTVSRIDGVPELMSVLHIVNASQSSLITCSSVTNESSTSTMFDSSAFPGSPQNVGARELSAGSCDILITWNPPDGSDIDRYIIYVTSQNNMDVFSTTTVLNIPNCRVGNNSIQVAAMNRLGCIGPNSSHIQPSLVEMPPTQDVDIISSSVIASAVVIILLIIIFVPVVISLSILLNRLRGRVIEQEHTIAEKDQENFIIYLEHLYKDLKRSRTSPIDEALPHLLNLVKKMPFDNIKEALKTVLKTKLTSARSIRHAINRLKKMIPTVISDFDAMLMKAECSVTMDGLMEATRQGEHQQLLDKLINQVDAASPEDVKDCLQQMFEALRVKGESDEELRKVSGTPDADHPAGRLPLYGNAN